MSKNTILDQMGITQWRLRENVSQLSQIDQTKVSKSSLSETSLEQEQTLVAEQESEIEPSDHSAQGNDQSLKNQDQKSHEYNWPELIERLNDKSLCQTCAKNIPIIGDGDITADWMFVFDSPSSRDIEQQELLTGRVGQLFDAILLALQLDRQSIYLSSIFKCPPAANISEDTALCNDLVRHQINLVQPSVVVALGEFTAQSLIKSNEDLLQLRAHAQHCGNQMIKVVPTFSLMQMLDSPLLKAQVWNDLKAARRLVES